MKTKVLPLILFIALATSTSTLHPGETEEMANFLKATGAIFAAPLILLAIDSYFEYQDDKIISKIKENDSEYKNATLWKEKAKISKAIITEYYKNFTFKKKWGRKCVRAGLFLGFISIASIYMVRNYLLLCESS